MTFLHQIFTVYKTVIPQHFPEIRDFRDPMHWKLQSVVSLGNITERCIVGLTIFCATYRIRCLSTAGALIVLRPGIDHLLFLHARRLSIIIFDTCWPRVPQASHTCLCMSPVFGHQWGSHAGSAQPSYMILTRGSP